MTLLVVLVIGVGTATWQGDRSAPTGWPLLTDVLICTGSLNAKYTDKSLFFEDVLLLPEATPTESSCWILSDLVGFGQIQLDLVGSPECSLILV